MTPYVMPDDTIVELPDDTPEVLLPSGGYALRADCAGRQSELSINILRVLGQVSKPQFAVALCSACGIIMHVNAGCAGITHGMCRLCIRRDYPEYADAVLGKES